jgi:hypothetical protein
MSKLKLFVVACSVALMASPAAFAQNLGKVTKANRAQVNIFDANGAPLGQVKASELKLPQPIVGFGKGNSVGIKQGNRVVYMRGLDVMTDKAKANCKPVSVASRQKGSAYAASNMGLGSAADCSSQ